VTALTMKQRLFVAEYLRDLNATAAAVRAGYSRRTARQMGAENLTKPDIAQAIAEAMERRAEAIRQIATQRPELFVRQPNHEILGPNT
jgi:phage terminase small subunit